MKVKWYMHKRLKNKETKQNTPTPDGPSGPVAELSGPSGPVADARAPDGSSGPREVSTPGSREPGVLTYPPPETWFWRGGYVSGVP